MAENIKPDKLDEEALANSRTAQARNNRILAELDAKETLSEEEQTRREKIQTQHDILEPLLPKSEDDESTNEN